MQSKKEDVNIEKMYGEFCITKKDKFLSKYNVNEQGLTNDGVENNRKKFGENEISQAKPKRWYNYFLESLFNPFNGILLGITAILFLTDVYIAETPNYANIIVIAILVSISSLLEFFEEYKSNKAAEKLKELVATTTTVLRNGKSLKIPIKEVVFGDIILLAAGDMMPADLRVIEANDLYVGQSYLTGESDVIKKVVEVENEKIVNITDLDNICFMGTNVISGSAKAVVIKTGDDTYFGRIAHTITNQRPKTAFQTGVENISKLLIRFMLILIPIVFIINYEKHSILIAFTFAVAVAICITPLLLPVILSSSLSKRCCKNV